MQATDTIQRYERILATSSQMVLAAEESRWDELIDMEIARRELILEATSLSTAPLADEKLQLHKETLIRGILAADERVKALTATWMKEMEGILSSVQAERKLARAYESR